MAEGYASSVSCERLQIGDEGHHQLCDVVHGRATLGSLVPIVIGIEMAEQALAGKAPATQSAALGAAAVQGDDGTAGLLCGVHRGAE